MFNAVIENEHMSGSCYRYFLKVYMASKWKWIFDFNYDNQEYYEWKKMKHLKIIFGNFPTIEYKQATLQRYYCDWHWCK